MISETVILRREMDDARKRLDVYQGVIQSTARAIDSLKEDLAEANAAKKRYEEQATVQRQRGDFYLHAVEILEDLLRKNKISFETIRIVKDDIELKRKELEEVKEALKKEKAKNRRVSNEHTPSSMGSDAQADLKKYRQENKDNYQPLDGDGTAGDNAGKGGARKGKGKKQESGNVLGRLFGRRSKSGGWSKPKNPAKRRKKETLEDMPVSHKADVTVDSCPECGDEVRGKTIVFDVIDTVPLNVATAATATAGNGADTRSGSEAMPQEISNGAVGTMTVSTQDENTAGYQPVIEWDTSSQILLPPDSMPEKDRAANASVIPKECTGNYSCAGADDMQQQQQKQPPAVQAFPSVACVQPSETYCLQSSHSMPQDSLQLSQLQPSSSQPSTSPPQEAGYKTMQTATTAFTPTTHGNSKDQDCESAALTTALGIKSAVKTRVCATAGTCASGHKVDTTPKGVTRGTVFGPGLMTLIVFLFSQTLSLGSIQGMLVMHGIESVSRTTIMNALAAVAVQKFASKADYISKRLGDSWFLMADETKFKIGKKSGYVWVFIGAYGIKVHVDRSRSRTVVDLHFPHFNIPIVVDGYAVYKTFKVRQRCWAHVLREAELLAVFLQTREVSM